MWRLPSLSAQEGGPLLRGPSRGFFLLHPSRREFYLARPRVQGQEESEPGVLWSSAPETAPPLFLFFFSFFTFSSHFFGSMMQTLQHPSSSSTGTLVICCSWMIFGQTRLRFEVGGPLSAQIKIRSNFIYSTFSNKQAETKGCTGLKHSRKRKTTENSWKKSDSKNTKGRQYKGPNKRNKCTS